MLPCTISNRITSSKISQAICFNKRPQAADQLQQKTQSGKGCTRCVKVALNRYQIMEKELQESQDPTSLYGIKKFLEDLGWDVSWVDTVLNQIRQKKLLTTVLIIKDVIQFFEDKGMDPDLIMNMACVDPLILGLNPEIQIQPVLDYVEAQGLKDVLSFCRFHPQLFHYLPSEDGTYLYLPETGAKAVVYCDEAPDGQQLLNVQYFRSTVKFSDAPIQPWLPPGGGDLPA